MLRPIGLAPRRQGAQPVQFLVLALPGSRFAGSAKNPYRRIGASPLIPRRKHVYFGVAWLCLMLSAGQAQDLPEGKGRDVALTVCTTCHPPLFAGMRGDRRFWESMIDRMIVRGALISDEQTKTLIDYLLKFFGPDVNINKAEAALLQKELDLTRAEAEAIAQHREEIGGFKEWADVEKVQGLDAKKLEPLKRRIVY